MYVHIVFLNIKQLQHLFCENDSLKNTINRNVYSRYIEADDLQKIIKKII